jgi:hypothetical protein
VNKYRLYRLIALKVHFEQDFQDSGDKVVQAIHVHSLQKLNS